MAGAVGDAVGSDATLRVRGGAVLMAHGAILARYEYFAAMLRFAREQGRGGAIDYAAAAPAVARQLLAYVYAGPDAVALDDPAETMALLVAADEARVANLVRLCERSLAARIGGDAGNARAVLEFCDHYASADGKLRAAALHVLE